MQFAGLSGDFNRLHTDEVYARQTIFGTRIAHGLLGLIISSGLINQMQLFEGSIIALLGYENWKFHAPLRIGDTIHARMIITGKRTTSKPDRGIVYRTIEVVNQNDEIIQSGQSPLLLKMRSASQPEKGA